MADQLDQLPQFFQTQSAQRGGGALFGGAGRSVVDLRAMGPARTLILLDGARLAPADRDGSVHIDNIPTALLSQVEVVTGGASAAYGADALAGVTNFRLNRTYDGMDVSVNTGATSDGLGDNRRVSVAYGSALGERGHIIASVEHQQIDPIEYDPLELGDWFQRYGIVANPGLDRRQYERTGDWFCPTSTRATTRPRAGSARPVRRPAQPSERSRWGARCSPTTAQACGRSRASAPSRAAPRPAISPAARRSSTA